MKKNQETKFQILFMESLKNESKNESLTHG